MGMFRICCTIPPRSDIPLNQQLISEYCSGVFSYLWNRAFSYGYGLWIMDNSIWIILFHTIMDRKPVGILADLTLTVGKSSRVQDKSIRIHAEQDLVGLLEELSDAENKNLEKVLW